MATPAFPKIEMARFKTLPPGGGQGVAFDVHFNPASLEHTIANTLKDEGGGGRKKQFVDRTTATLKMQLVFDTTDSGEDVRTHTDKMAKLLQPVADDGKQVPPNVEFSWGVYRFTGMVEKYKEVIDFFAASGVPLRSTVDLTLASQDVQFDSDRNPKASVDRGGSEPALMAGVGGAAGIAVSLGDPRAARAIASVNGSASLRFGAEAGLAVGGGIQLQAEAGFSAGAGSSAGSGLGVGVGGGFALEAGGGAGFGVGGGVGIGAGAGGSAAGGAFAGLRAGASRPRPLPSARSLLGPPGGTTAISGGASFGLTGQVKAGSGASMGADVGAGADLAALIRFD
jgi:hypothetical protein